MKFESHPPGRHRSGETLYPTPSEILNRFALLSLYTSALVFGCAAVNELHRGNGWNAFLLGGLGLKNFLEGFTHGEET